MNGSWAYDYVTTVGPRTFNPNTQQTNIYVQDAAMAAAVDVINNSPDILPYTTVKIKRFSDCGPYAFTGYAPGYAMSVMATEIGEKHTDVIGVTGVESSITAKGTAEVFGNYQIPYCGAMSASPVLSDKEKYPYFFRVVASSGLGNHVSTLLKAWNVTRMAIVVQTDDLASSAFGTDVRKAMERQKIDVIDVINIKAPLTKDTVKFVAQSILRGDARYIYIAAANDLLSKLYFSLAVEGLVNSKHVYMGLQGPSQFGTGLNLLRPEVTAIALNVTKMAMLSSGFIAFTPAVASGIQDSYWKQALYNSFVSITKLDKTLQKYFFANPSALLRNFATSSRIDCTMMLLLGMDKFLKQNPQFTPQQLAKRELLPYLNYTRFLNLNYKGLVSAPGPVTLNEQGDLAVPYYILCYAWNNQKVTYITDIVNYVGITTPTGDDLSFFNNTPAIFYGGSKILPPDGPPVIQYSLLTNNLYSSAGQGMLTMGIIGLAISVFFAIIFIKFRATKQLKMTSVPECLVTIFGSGLCYVSLFFYLQDVSQSNCINRIWLVLVGYVFMIVPVIMKNIRLYIILKSKTRVDAAQLTMIVRIFIAFGILIQIALLSYWHASTNNTPSKIYSDLIYFYACSSSNASNSSSIQLLAGYTAIIHVLLLALAFLMKDVDATFNESPALTSIFAIVGILVAVVEIIPSNATPNLDLIQCICIFLATTITLFLLFAQKVYDVTFEHLIEKGLMKLSIKSGSDNTKSSFGNPSIKKSAMLASNIDVEPVTLKRDTGKSEINQSIGIGFKESPALVRNKSARDLGNDAFDFV
ncbi:hypothetical protein HDU79_001900 [Rhizoclosmatium sp. JEL0117]|nr:hypothetical protein HDU79_001900 [Rhizoclosmatium sp. JEL0117]